jgi:hypothetical protein
MTTTTTTYKRFNIQADDEDASAHLKKTVDDYELENKKNRSVLGGDAARVAMSHRSACRMLPMSHVSAAQRMFWLPVVPVVSALAPNRIEARYFTRSSRVRNMVHGGITGLLAVRLLHNSRQGQSQCQTLSRSLRMQCIIRRVNSEAGCEHVKWSIPEFQCRYNIGVKILKRICTQYDTMTDDEVFSELNLLDTAENRQAFLEECKAVANAPNQSRIKYAVDVDVAASVNEDDSNSKWCKRRYATVLDNEWIAHFIATFSKACSIKMAAVGNTSLSKLSRAMNLVDLFRFVSSRIDWILTDPVMRHMTNLAGFWEKYTDRLTFMATEGIEHAALMLARYFPEMMTPELHVVVVVNAAVNVYRVPQMQIADDDELFGPMKAACQAFMPDAAPEPVPVPRRNIYYDDYDYDDYDGDYDNDEYTDDEEDDYEAQS